MRLRNYTCRCTIAHILLFFLKRNKYSMTFVSVLSAILVAQFFLSIMSSLHLLFLPTLMPLVFYQCYYNYFATLPIFIYYASFAIFRSHLYHWYFTCINFTRAISAMLIFHLMQWSHQILRLINKVHPTQWYYGHSFFAV